MMPSFTVNPPMAGELNLPIETTAVYCTPVAPGIHLGSSEGTLVYSRCRA
jgi:hypothetical protein